MFQVFCCILQLLTSSSFDISLEIFSPEIWLVFCFYVLCYPEGCLILKKSTFYNGQNIYQTTQVLLFSIHAER